MIVVTGEIELHPEDAWPATSAALKMMEASAKEDGCICYRVYNDILDPRRFRIYEEWRDEDALKAHFETAHMATFQKALSTLRILTRKVEKLAIANRTPI